MTDWAEEEGVITDWFGNVIDPPVRGLLLETETASSLLLEDGEFLLLES